MSATDAQLDADRMVYMLQLRDQRNALCAIARAFGWGSEDWTVERLVAEAARLRVALSASEIRRQALEAALVSVVAERDEAHRLLELEGI